MSDQLMKKKSFWKYNSVLVVLVLVLLFCISFFLKTEIASKNSNSNGLTEVTNKKISVFLKIINGSEKSYILNDISNKLTVFDITKKNIKLKYNNNYDFGVFIESVDGVKNGDEGKYWQYYINDKLGNVAADKKLLEDGDVVEWRFEDVSSFN